MTSFSQLSTSGEPSGLGLIDVAAAREIGRVPVGDTPYAVALHGGRAFVTDQHGDTVSVFDPATLAPVARIDYGGEYPESIAATADGRILVADWFSNTLSVIDAASLKTIAAVKVGDGPRAFGAFVRRTR